jgi:hypothetical protein
MQHLKSSLNPMDKEKNSCSTLKEAMLLSFLFHSQEQLQIDTLQSLSQVFNLKI